MLSVRIAFAALFLFGCSVHVRHPEPEDDPKTFYAKQNALREQHSAARQEESEKRDSERRARLEKEEAERRAQNEARREGQKTEKANELSASCEADRPAREAEMQKRIDSFAHKEAFQEWESEHCQMVDRSKPVIKTVQDANGEYHTFEGRDRAAGLECDAKRPEVFKESRAQYYSVYYPPSAIAEKNSECLSSDLKVSEIAKIYKTVGKSRNSH